MTKKEKAYLRYLCKQGESFDEIRLEVNCADSTIRAYMKQFSPINLKLKASKP